MQFSDTTNKNGLIQECEFWTGKNDGDISGDSTLLKVFTSRLNRGFEHLMPLLIAWTTKLKWDDSNHTDLPVGTFDLADDEADYTIAEDDNSLDILNIVTVEVLPSATATTYVPVEIITLDDERVSECLSPASTTTGTPTLVLVRGNTLHFNKFPGYDATAGGRISFEREQSYFVSGDTTKEPGIPKPFHPLLAKYASKDWLAVNTPNNGTLIADLKDAIATDERNLRSAIKGRFPARTQATAAAPRPFRN